MFRDVRDFLISAFEADDVRSEGIRYPVPVDHLPKYSNVRVFLRVLLIHLEATQIRTYVHRSRHTAGKYLD